MSYRVNTCIHSHQWTQSIVYTKAVRFALLITNTMIGRKSREKLKNKQSCALCIWVSSFSGSCQVSREYINIFPRERPATQFLVFQRIGQFPLFPYTYLNHKGPQVYHNASYRSNFPRSIHRFDHNLSRWQITCFVFLHNLG